MSLLEFVSISSTNNSLIVLGSLQFSLKIVFFCEESWQNHGLCNFSSLLFYLIEFLHTLHTTLRANDKCYTCT